MSFYGYENRPHKRVTIHAGAEYLVLQMAILDTLLSIEEKLDRLGNGPALGPRNSMKPISPEVM